MHAGRTMMCAATPVYGRYRSSTRLIAQSITDSIARLSMLIGAGLLAAAPAFATTTHPASEPAAEAASSSRTPAPADPHAAAVAQLIDSARMWSNKYRNDIALQLVQKALLISPDDPNALFELGQIQIRSNQFDDASHLLFRLQTLYPQAAQTRELKYEYLYATSWKPSLDQIAGLIHKDQTALAVQKLQALFSDGPPTGDLAADYYSILGEDRPHRPDAIRGLQQVIAADPRNLNAAIELALMYDRPPVNSAESLRIIRQVAENPDADRSAALAAWRQIQRDAGPDPAYIQSLEAYVAMVPDDEEFQHMLVASRAALAARLKLEADPDWQAEQKGLKLLAQNQLDAAEPLLLEALRTRGSDPDLLGALGQLRMRQGRQLEARPYFLQAAKFETGPQARIGWQNQARTALFWGTLGQGRAALSQGHPAQAEQAARTALGIEPAEPNARSLLADALSAQHRYGEAETVYRGLLAEPGQALDALRDLTTMLRASGRAAEIAPLMTSMQGRFSGADKTTFDSLRSDQLSDEADTLLAQGKSGPAIETLERAIRLAPDAAWTRFKLARTYRDLGLPQLGRQVMEEGRAASTAPEMAYASALYLNSIDDVGEALAAFAPMSDAQMSDGMRALQRNLQAQQLLVQAQRQFAAHRTADGERTLNEAAHRVPDDPDMLASIGRLWIAQGQSKRGLALLRTWLDAHPNDPAVDIRLRYGDLLAAADREDDLARWLATLRNRTDLTPAQIARLEDQSLRQALRRADVAQSASDYRKAEAILKAVDAAGKADPRWALEIADLRRAEGRYAQARAAVAPVLAKDPNNLDAKLTLARIDEQSGQTRQALVLVHEVLEAAPPDDSDTRLSAVRRLVALQQYDEAEAILNQLAARNPSDPDVTMQRGRTLQSAGQYDLARAAYLQAESQEPAAGVAAGPEGTPAEVALFDLDQRRQPLIETAFYGQYKSGTDGASALREDEVPLYIQLPQGYRGHWFFHADTVYVDAGTLNPVDPGASFSDASQVGTFAAYNPATTFSQTPGAADVLLKGPLEQHATGVAVGIGFETDNWRADLGTTPIGFPIQNVVGGFRFSVPNDFANLSINLSRRPETSSMLSYAGLHDPVTDQVYGGVVRDGIDIYTSKDIGPVNVFAGLGAGVFTGHNVATNQGETLRTGIDVPIFSRPNWHLDTGLVGNLWHYSQNLRFYTFGQGGYYSPQRYLSLGVPLDWVARYDKASWELDTSVGLSHTYEADSPFFPTDPALQAASLANSVNNTNTGSTGGGISYSVSAIFQYLFTRHLTAGFSVSIDRSHDYAPTTAMAYLRYTFNPGRGTVAFPRAVTPYSDY